MNDKNSKSIAIIALALAIVGLGVGFAAFQSTLTISTSATVTPSSTTFTGNIGFDTSVGSCVTSGEGITASEGTVTTTAITDLTVAFTEPGQYALCTYKVKNTSPYLAYLTNIKYGTGSNLLECTRTDSTATTGLVTAACNTITVTTQVGGSAFGTDGSSATLTSAANNSLAITNGTHTLAATSGQESVYVKVQYDGPARADGAFSVTIPQIGLTYSTVQ